MGRQACLILLLSGYWINPHVQAQPLKATSSGVHPDRTSQPYTGLDNPDDRFWDDRFGVGGPFGWIQAMIADPEGNVLVGGAFTTAGSHITDLIARWDGASWMPVGSGIMSEDLFCDACRWIQDLAVDNSGTIYAAGRHLLDDRTFAARLDGDSWSPMGTGNWSGEAFALTAETAGNVYAGGYFYGQREQAREYLLRWNGSDWDPLGGGVNGSVTAIVSDKQSGIFVGGRFDSTAGVPAGRVARWDGAVWSPLGAGINGWVEAMALDPDGNLIVGGYFESAGGIPVHNIARWDGATWSPIGEGIDGPIYSISIDHDGKLIVGGRFDSAGGIPANNIARWDGISWSPLGTGVDGVVSALMMDAQGRLFAAGGFSSVAGKPAFNAAMWDGNRWSALSADAGQGLNGAAIAIAPGEDGNLYVGGGFTFAGETFSGSIAAWDGNGWSPLGAGLDGWVTSIAIDGDGNVFAGGSTTLGSVTAWNGESWSSLGAGPNGSVHAIAFDHQDNLFAGGRFDSVGSMPAKNIAMWDGETWSPLGEGLEGGWSPSVDALAVDHEGNVFVGGNFATAGGIPAGHIARWDGAAWSAIGGGIDSNGSVHALALDEQGKLYAGGNFSRAGGTHAYNVAVWDGVAWNPLGIGFNTTVRALAVAESGEIYAAGQFTALGPSANRAGYSHIAGWDGKDWFPLASGTEKEVYAIALDRNGFLYAGGRFSLAGMKSSAGIARWDAPSYLASVGVEQPARGTGSSMRLTEAYPNPFTHHTTLEVIVDEPQHMVVTLFDVSGRQIRNLFDGFSMGPEVHHIRVQAASLASGTYFVRIHGESFIGSHAVTLLR